MPNDELEHELAPFSLAALHLASFAVSQGPIFEAAGLIGLGVAGRPDGVCECDASSEWSPTAIAFPSVSI